jgi:hypothetical protein
MNFDKWWTEHVGHPPTYDQQEAFELARAAFNYAEWYSDVGSEKISPPTTEAVKLTLPIPENGGRRIYLHASRKKMIVEGHLMLKGERAAFESVREDDHIYWVRIDDDGFQKS